MRSPPRDPGPCGIYVHVPFCGIRCTYCDFATFAGRDDRVEAYLAALRCEIRSGQRGLPPEADTVFVGGGTPSRMRGADLRGILDETRDRFDLADDTEVTVEANPEDVQESRVASYIEAGMNRISIGVQSLDDAVLRRVGRAHDGARALAALRVARAAGVPRVNADLIAGLPGERAARWGETLERVADAGPDHVSVYLLETDKDAPLARSIREGRTRGKSDETMVGLYKATVTTLTRMGYEQYEISNFAREGCRSLHNLKYWRDEPYGGFGLAAHAYFDGERRWNRRDLEGYIASAGAGDDPVDGRDPWSPTRRLEEALMMGLRLNEGLDLAAVSRRYGRNVDSGFAEVWSMGQGRGWLLLDEDRIALTEEGRIWSNELFREILGHLVEDERGEGNA